MPEPPQTPQYTGGPPAIYYFGAPAGGSMMPGMTGGVHESELKRMRTEIEEENTETGLIIAAAVGIPAAIIGLWYFGYLDGIIAMFNQKQEQEQEQEQEQKQARTRMMLELTQTDTRPTIQIIA